MAFDKLLFNGGLKQEGVILGNSYGHEVHCIRDFSSLNGLLGECWWYRCLNTHCNFCYINIDTVQFYLDTRRSVGEYNPEKSKWKKYWLVTCWSSHVCEDGWMC